MAWAKIDDEFHRHPKARAAGLRGRALYVAGLCWANYQRSDGRIEDRDLAIVAAEAEVSPATAKKLVEIGLWDRVDGGYQIHDFLEHNFSAEQMEERRAKRASAGRRGGIRSGHVRRSKSDDRPDPEPPPGEASAEANAEANASANGEAPANPMSHDPCISVPSSSSERGRAASQDELRYPRLATRVATVLAERQRPGTIRTSRTGWITAAARDVSARPGWQRDVDWLAEHHPELRDDHVDQALASRHADGHWPTYVTVPDTRPDAWAGLPGEPDHDPEAASA